MLVTYLLTYLLTFVRWSALSRALCSRPYSTPAVIVTMLSTHYIRSLATSRTPLVISSLISSPLSSAATAMHTLKAYGNKFTRVIRRSFFILTHSTYAVFDERLWTRNKMFLKYCLPAEFEQSATTYFQATTIFSDKWYKMS